jgi:oligopeptide/dipeptide ABC transporter ATP-binding protein
MITTKNGIVLAIRGLKCHLFTEEGVIRAVDDVSFDIRQGETLGLVGESGCGKSMTALSIMGLFPKPIGKIIAGEIDFIGKGDLTRLTEPEMRKIRGKEISMIFQEPMTSLNPVFQIGKQIAEAIQLHHQVSKKEAWKRSIGMLKQVGIPSPEKRIKDYPHQLSGGMQQRVMIAMALSCRPQLMLADEPTTALDVTIQAQILDLMNRLKEEVGTSIALITHNFGIIGEMAQHVSVMYAGTIVESTCTSEIFHRPLHPYTVGLLRSVPRIGFRTGEKSELHTISGSVPNLINLPNGCRFSSRCEHVHSPCRVSEPSLIKVEQDHSVRCWLHQKSPNA